jgi:hypothetical protein
MLPHYYFYHVFYNIRPLCQVIFYVQQAESSDCIPNAIIATEYSSTRTHFPRSSLSNATVGSEHRPNAPLVIVFNTERQQ